MTTVASRISGRSELGIAALLGAVGALVLWDAATLDAPQTTADVLGPEAMPFVIGALLLVCAGWLALDVLRGGHGEEEGGEDIDLSHPIEWRVVLPLVGVLLGNVLLVDLLGWVISGALLFWGSAWTLGSRHPVRDAVVSLLLSLGTFYGFYVGLGIYLPAGLLEGVL